MNMRRLVTCEASPSFHWWDKLKNLFGWAGCWCEGEQAESAALRNLYAEQRKQQQEVDEWRTNMKRPGYQIAVAMMMGPLGPEGAEIEAAADSVATEAVAAESGWVRVGRWMSKEELASMEATEVAQESTSLGGSRVALPATADAYKDAAAGSVYVEYDIPAGVTKPAGSGWARIPGPNSIEGRSAEAAGRSVPQMPQVKNIKVVKSN